MAGIVCLVAALAAQAAVAAPAPVAPSPTSGPTAGGTVVSGAVPVFELAAGTDGGFSSYAIAADGSLWAWGSSWWGPSTTMTAPVPTGSNLTFTAVSAYDTYTGYALATDGSISSWGDNKYGQLGNGSTNPLNRATMSQVLAPSGLPYSSVTAGYLAGYGIASDGTVWAWGDNVYGQLGDGIAESSSPVPVRVSLPAGLSFQAVTTGAYNGTAGTDPRGTTGGFSVPTVYALTTDGAVWAWGDNVYGQLGDGTTNNSYTPVPVTMTDGVTFASISAGPTGCYALDTAGHVWAWGNFRDTDQANRGNSPTPVELPLPNGMTFTQIAIGFQSNYGLAADGTIWAWGNNTAAGSLGAPVDGVTTFITTPIHVQTPNGLTFDSIAAGWSTGYGVATDGSIWTWGQGIQGQLGTGALKIPGSRTPLQVAPQIKITAVTFDGVPVEFAQTGNQWTATAPGGCGPVDVVVSYSIGDVKQPDVTFPGGFVYGSTSPAFCKDEVVPTQQVQPSDPPSTPPPAPPAAPAEPMHMSNTGGAPSGAGIPATIAGSLLFLAGLGLALNRRYRMAPGL